MIPPIETGEELDVAGLIRANAIGETIRTLDSLVSSVAVTGAGVSEPFLRGLLSERVQRARQDLFSVLIGLAVFGKDPNAQAVSDQLQQEGREAAT